MLSREDSRRLAQLERQLLRDDPEFCARMTAGHPAARHRRPPISLILTAVVAWVAAIILAVVGWWIAAALAGVCATALLVAVVRRLNRMGPQKPDIPDSPAGLGDVH